MRRWSLAVVVDLASFAVLLCLAGTACVLRYGFDLDRVRLALAEQGPAPLAAGLTRHQWGELHFWAAMAFLACVAVHLLIHRRRIARFFRGGPGRS